MRECQTIPFELEEVAVDGLLEEVNVPLLVFKTSFCDKCLGVGM